MALTVPTKNTGDQLTAAEFNEVLSKVNEFDDQVLTSTDITDFDAEVTNNTTVVANTAKVSYTDAAAVALNTAKISADGSIATHSDVDLTGLADNNVLKYNTGTGKWEPATEAAGGGLAQTDIDTLAELNAIVTDATLIDTGDSRLSDARTPTAHNHTASEVTDFDTEVANNTNVGANTTHRTSDGSDHTFIDQDVTSGASPTFNGVNITGVTVGSTQQLYINARAGTSTIAIGVPVYISGYNAGGWYTVEPADASNSATMPASGITTVSTTTTLTVQLIIAGRLTGLDTSLFSQNDAIYVASGGGFTSTKPTGTNLIQKVGIVSRVHPSTGVILVTGAGRTNDIPNIADGSVWIGDGSGVATPTDLDTLISANSSVTANTAKTTNATHTGEVTGDTALTIADNIIDEANLKLDEAPTNDFVLTADSTKTGGMKWAAAAGGGGGSLYTFQRMYTLDHNNTTAWMSTNKLTGAKLFEVDDLAGISNKGASTTTMDDAEIATHGYLFCAPYDMDISLLRITYGNHPHLVDGVSFLRVVWSDAQVTTSTKQIIYENIGFTLSSTEIGGFEITSTFSNTRLNKGDFLYDFHSTTNIAAQCDPTEIYIECTPV